MPVRSGWSISPTCARRCLTPTFRGRPPSTRRTLITAVRCRLPRRSHELREARPDARAPSFLCRWLPTLRAAHRNPLTSATSPAAHTVRSANPLRRLHAVRSHLVWWCAGTGRAASLGRKARQEGCGECSGQPGGDACWRKRAQLRERAGTLGDAGHRSGIRDGIHRRHRGGYRLAGYRPRFRRQPDRTSMGCHRVHARPGRAAAVRRDAGRPVRPEADLPDRRHMVRAVLAAVRVRRRARQS